jgi:phosphatidyl-myo-inositol dimannoside synthase
MNQSVNEGLKQVAQGKAAVAKCRVMLLSPSRGMGGGIERYVETLEWAFEAQRIACRRIDLSRPGALGHIRMLEDGRKVLRASPDPTRVIVAHWSLLPMATLLAQEPLAGGMSVLCHGCEVWGPRLRLRRIVVRRLMRRSSVRPVAVSAYTAGTLAADCPATILPPGLSQEWFDLLVAAGQAAANSSPGIHLVTVLRLSDWREKGLSQLIDAIMALRRRDTYLTVCGSGNPPPELLRLLADHSWCKLRVNLTNEQLARELASANLFVLATRTRHGRRAYGEGFGLALLEAQVAGTPVIAPARGGSSGAYIEGVTGAAPANETTEALTRALADLLEKPDRLARMGNYAAGWAREAFAPLAYARLAVNRLL